MQTSEINAPKPGKQALIVVGMHRSGSSATTGALQCLGVQLGKKLYAGHSNINPKGYFEHGDLTDIDDEALWSLGSSWDDVLLKEEGWWTQKELHPFTEKIREIIRREFADSPLWAFKDPRVCRLLPWWLDILAAEGISPCFLFLIRSPDDVCQSLVRRDGFSRDKAFLLWVLHYLEAERATRGRVRSFMQFDQFLENPIDEFLRVERQLGLRFPVPVAAAADCLSQFLSKELRHHSGGGSRPSATPIVGLAYEVEANLLQAAQNQGAQPDPAGIDGTWRRLEEIQRSFSPVVLEQLRAVGLNRGQTQLTLNRVMRSWSAYAGKPIRFLERLVGRDV